MNQQTVNWLVVGSTFVLYLWISVRARAGTTGEFYVSGKGVHPVLNGMATAADWMSAASFISMAGMIAMKGYDASVFVMGWTGGYCLLAMLLAPYLRKYGKFTVPAFIGDRYYSDAARIVAVICLIIASLTYVIGQMKGIGVTLSRFFEISYEKGLIVGMGIVFVYAVWGGMKGITYTQIAQYCVLIFAYTVPAVFISLQLTGSPVPQLGLGGQMNDGSGLHFLDKLNKTLLDLGFGEHTARKDSIQNIFLSTLCLMIGTAGLPHVITRFFTVPKVRDARSSVGWSLVFIAILYTTAPAVGAMARFNLMETIRPNGGEWIKYENRPEWFKKWEATKLLEFKDKNGDGRIQYLKDAEKNEMVKVDNDIMVLASPEIAHLSPWIIALVAAGAIAAALSTAAGLLLAISSSVSHDLLKGIFMKKMSDRNELLAGRIVLAGAILMSGCFGLNPPGFAAQVVALAFGLAASSIFPALMLGIFVKRINKAGAIAGMLSGISVTLLYIFWFKGWFFLPGAEMAKDAAENWLFGISPEAFGPVGALVNFVVACVVSSITPPPPEHIQHLVEDIRVPGMVKRT